MMRLLFHLAGVHVRVVSILMKKKKAWKKNSQPTSAPLNGIFFSLLAFDVLGFADL
jgi:hypothetical protein